MDRPAEDQTPISSAELRDEMRQLVTRLKVENLNLKIAGHNFANGHVDWDEIKHLFELPLKK